MEVRAPCLTICQIFVRKWLFHDKIDDFCPEGVALQIDEYYKKQNEAKEEAVDNDLMKEQHPSMKFQKESNTRVTFGGTKK